jgi:hypothetical protein
MPEALIASAAEENTLLVMVRAETWSGEADSAAAPALGAAIDAPRAENELEARRPRRAEAQKRRITGEPCKK